MGNNKGRPTVLQKTVYVLAKSHWEEQKRKEAEGNTSNHRSNSNSRSNPNKESETVVSWERDPTYDDPDGH